MVLQFARLVDELPHRGLPVVGGGGDGAAVAVAGRRLVAGVGHVVAGVGCLVYFDGNKRGTNRSMWLEKWGEIGGVPGLERFLSVPEILASSCLEAV